MKIDVSKDGRTFTLLETTSILSGEVIVPKGFSWDGASVPWFVTPIIPRAYTTLEASCLHDYLCRRAESYGERKTADRLFITVLKSKEFNKFRLALGYLGVRFGALLGIGVHYNNHAVNNIRKKAQNMLKFKR